MKRKNILSEIWSFLWKNKAYWIFPVVVFLLMLIIVIAIGTSPITPFVYTMI